MSQEPIQKYRGVICQCCRQPIPLPGIVLRIEDSRRMDRATGQHDPERVFALRCRSCEREMPYLTSEIVEIDGVPKRRLSRLATRDAVSATRTASA